jgi:hypothetical protein
VRTKVYILRRRNSDCKVLINYAKINNKILYVYLFLRCVSHGAKELSIFWRNILKMFSPDKKENMFHCKCIFAVE